MQQRVTYQNFTQTTLVVGLLATMTVYGALLAASGNALAVGLTAPMAVAPWFILYFRPQPSRLAARIQRGAFVLYQPLVLLLLLQLLTLPQ
jgi:hypothetical protein